MKREIHYHWRIREHMARSHENTAIWSGRCGRGASRSRNRRSIASWGKNPNGSRSKSLSRCVTSSVSRPGSDHLPRDRHPPVAQQSRQRRRRGTPAQCLPAGQGPHRPPMTEPRSRGRPRTTGDRECARCHGLAPTIRTTWPEGPVCGPCFTAAARTYGWCAFCGAHRLLPGRSPSGHNICRDCAGITTNLVCDNCGREAERRRGGHCARCVVTADLTQILKPHAPPDMRIKRLITELAAVPRPESITTWMRHPVTAAVLTKIGTRELSSEPRRLRRAAALTQPGTSTRNAGPSPHDAQPR